MYYIYNRFANRREPLHGNDTIDCYPPWDVRIEKILCVSGKVLKRIQWDFYRFLKDNKAPCKPKVKKKLKGKIKPSVKAALPPNGFEPWANSGAVYNVFNHRKGRMKDWHNTYGQGMYE